MSRRHQARRKRKLKRGNRKTAIRNPERGKRQEGIQKRNTQIGKQVLGVRGRAKRHEQRERGMKRKEGERRGGKERKTTKPNQTKQATTKTKKQAEHTNKRTDSPTKWLRARINGKTNKNEKQLGK